MRRTVLYIIGVFLLLFIVVFFLNCGTANADPMVRKNKIDHVTYSEAHQQLSAASKDESCQRIEATYEYANYLNNVLFRYTLTGRWCYDGEKVTWVKWSAPDRYSISAYPWNLWTFKGAQTPENGGGKGMRYAFRRNTGVFGVDIAWYHHTETSYVQCTVRGDGTSWCGKSS
jgi:hypothetical protein